MTSGYPGPYPGEPSPEERGRYEQEPAREEGPYHQSPYPQGASEQAPQGPNPYGQGSYPYPPGGYPAPGYGYAQPPYQRRGAGMAIAALVLGILAILLCWTVIGGIVLGLVAVILGIIAYRRARRGEAEGRGRALAGLITGAFGILLALALIAVGLSLLNSSSVRNLRTCLQDAGSDQAAVQQCEQEFRDQLNGG